MIRNLFLVSLSIFIFLISFKSEAKAKLFLNLNLGIEGGSWASEEILIQSSTGNKLEMFPTGNIYGYAYSARLDLILKYFLIGAEYYSSKTTWTYNYDPDNLQDDLYRKVDVNKSAAYLIIGAMGKYEKWAIWAGMSPLSNLKFNSNINPEEAPVTFTGRSYKIGMGIRLSRNRKSRIWVNMEYVIDSFEKVYRDGTSTTMPGIIGSHTYGKLDQGVIIFSLTFKLGKLRGSG